MKRTHLVLALAVVGVALSGAGDGRADEGFELEDFNLRDTQDLLDLCTISPAHDAHHMAMGYCLGFIEGGKHYHDALTGEVDDEHDPIVCSDDQVTNQEALDVFVAYARKNKDSRDEPAMETVYRALVAKWPCD